MAETVLKKHKLKNILSLERYMKIAIDEYVEMNENGDYAINVGYLRVSTDKQADEGYGLEIQEQAVVDFCNRCGFKNLVLFIDDGVTGTKMDRPALNGIVKMIENYNNGKTHFKVNAMIIPRIDRLGRTLLGTLQFIQDYIVAEKEAKNTTKNRNKESIEFYSVGESYCRVEKNNPQSTLLLGLFATLAEYDRDQIVKKLKDGMLARVSKGKWMGGGRVPYGYTYDKDVGKLQVVPEEAEKIREAYRLFIEEHISPQKIADRLGFKGERVVSEILRRKTLTGCLIYLGKEYEGEHEAIIPLERWEEAQDEIEKRSVHRAQSNYLLSGLVYCGDCGAKMRYQKWGKGTKIVCYSTQKSKAYLVKDENCNNKTYWADDIEKAVIETLFEFSYEGNSKNKKTEAELDPIEQLEKNLKNARIRLGRLYDLYSENADEDTILFEKISRQKEIIRQYERELEKEKRTHQIKRKIDRANKIIDSIKDTWHSMSDTEKQSTCQDLIYRVVVSTDGEIDLFLKKDRFVKNEEDEKAEENKEK